MQNSQLDQPKRSAPEPGSPRSRPVVPLASGPSMWVLVMPDACSSPRPAMVPAAVVGMSPIKLR